MRLKLEIDFETAERLVEAASAERRPLAWQAEMLLRRALGLSPKCDRCRDHEQDTQEAADAAHA